MQWCPLKTTITHNKPLQLVAIILLFMSQFFNPRDWSVSTHTRFLLCRQHLQQCWTGYEEDSLIICKRLHYCVFDLNDNMNGGKVNAKDQKHLCVCVQSNAIFFCDITTKYKSMIGHGSTWFNFLCRARKQSYKLLLFIEMCVAEGGVNVAQQSAITAWSLLTGRKSETICCCFYENFSL